MSAPLTKRPTCWMIGHIWEADESAGTRHADPRTGRGTGRRCTHCGHRNDGDPYGRGITPSAWVAVTIAPVVLSVAAVLAPSWEVRIPWIVAAAIAVMFGFLTLTATRILNYFARDSRRARAETERLREQLAAPRRK